MPEQGVVVYSIYIYRSIAETAGQHSVHGKAVRVPVLEKVYRHGSGSSSSRSRIPIPKHAAAAAAALCLCVQSSSS